MQIDYFLSYLSDNRSYTRNDLLEILRRDNENISESTFRWLLYNLRIQGRLFRVGFDEYSVSKPIVLPEYHPFYTDDVMRVKNLLESKYPEMSFVMFESVALNEFLNHQIAQNTVFVQVEKDVSTYIFDILKRETGGMVLYKPNNAEFSKYWTRGCIVVLELISQAPLSTIRPHEITMEKMLVDIIADKSIKATYSPSELPEIFKKAQTQIR